jgi:hypothetical protein
VPTFLSHQWQKLPMLSFVPTSLSPVLEIADVAMRAHLFIPGDRTTHWTQWPFKAVFSVYNQIDLPSWGWVHYQKICWNIFWQNFKAECAITFWDKNAFLKNAFLNQMKFSVTLCDGICFLEF